MILIRPQLLEFYLVYKHTGRHSRSNKT